MTVPNEKKIILDGKPLPKIYADQFVQVSYGASVSKIMLATESDNEIRPIVELVMPTENLIGGLKFMVETFNDPELKQTMIKDVERLLETLKK